MPLVNIAPILIVEDNEDDVFLLRRAFKKEALSNPLLVKTSAEDAQEYLDPAGPYADRDAHPLPLLTLLDIHLPGMSGLELLAWIRSTPQLKRLLVVLLTSSSDEGDVDTAYSSGANSYLVKPGSPDELRKLVHNLKLYWVVTNVPPRLDP